MCLCTSLMIKLVILDPMLIFAVELHVYCIHCIYIYIVHQTLITNIIQTINMYLICKIKLFALIFIYTLALAGQNGGTKLADWRKK